MRIFLAAVSFICAFAISAKAAEDTTQNVLPDTAAPGTKGLGKTLPSKLKVYEDSLDGQKLLFARIEIANSLDTTICIPTRYLRSGKRPYWRTLVITDEHGKTHGRSFDEYGHPAALVYEYVVLPPGARHTTVIEMSPAFEFGLIKNWVNYTATSEILALPCSALERGLFDEKRKVITSLKKEGVAYTLPLILIRSNPVRFKY